VQAGRVQAAALFGAELWWKGEEETGTLSYRDDIQKRSTRDESQHGHQHRRPRRRIWPLLGCSTTQQPQETLCVGTCKPTEGRPSQGTRVSREQRHRSQLVILPGLRRPERRNSVARDGGTFRRQYHHGGGDESQVLSRATSHGASHLHGRMERRMREPQGYASPGRNADAEGAQGPHGFETRSLRRRVRSHRPRP